MDLTGDYPQELLDFYQANSNYSSSVHNSYTDSYNDPECAYYPIEFGFNTELLLQECKQVEHLYFDHRSQDKKSGYGHRGWQSLTLHGIDKHKTEHFTKYGFNSLEEANYHWTEVCELVPNLYKFLSSLPFKLFDRVRIMRLAPNGYIMPHSDNKYQRAFSPLNIAINNPDGCHFVFKDKGIVPFVAGTGMVLDVGREHIVVNNSDQARYHIIVHGHYSKDFYNL
jgi:hypothetical protein